MTRPAPTVTVPVEPYMGSPEALAGMTQAIVKADAEFGHELSAYRYRVLAKAAFDTVLVGLSAAPAPEGGAVDDDVRRLVIAARNVAFDTPTQSELRALDIASEAFASRVPWDEEPEALATREEAPAEAGEPKYFAAFMAEDGALRAQPQAREDARRNGLMSALAIVTDPGIITGLHTAVEARSWIERSIRSALAALQAEQKGGA